MIRGTNRPWKTESSVLFGDSIPPSVVTAGRTGGFLSPRDSRSRQSVLHIGHGSSTGLCCAARVASSFFLWNTAFSSPDLCVRPRPLQLASMARSGSRRSGSLSRCLRSIWSQIVFATTPFLNLSTPQEASHRRGRCGVDVQRARSQEFLWGEQ